MAKVIRKIEKEFILDKVAVNRVPVILQYTNTETSSVIANILKDSVAIRMAPGMESLTSGVPVNCYFSYAGQVMYFKTRVVGRTDSAVLIGLPDEFYKDLGRKFSRIPQPRGASVSFSFKGERYELEFPRSGEFDPVDQPEYSATFNSDNIQDLIRQFRQKADDISPVYRISMFREKPPETLPERLISKTGKALFVSSYNAVLPTIDPYEHKRIITQDIFEAFLEEERGIDEETARRLINEIFRERRDAGIVSEVYCPILFQEYVIGYVYICNKNLSRPVFNIEVFELLYQFSRILSYSLKINGYFKNREELPESYKAEIIDLSASGMLFAHPADSRVVDLLVPMAEILIRLTISGRDINVPGTIVRRYRDPKMSYFGVQYNGLMPEDLRFLFEFLYGRPFTDTDALAFESQLFSSGKSPGEFM